MLILFLKLWVMNLDDLWVGKSTKAANKYLKQQQLDADRRTRDSIVRAAVAEGKRSSTYAEKLAKRRLKGIIKRQGDEGFITARQYLGQRQNIPLNKIEDSQAWLEARVVAVNAARAAEKKKPLQPYTVAKRAYKDGNSTAVVAAAKTVLDIKRKRDVIAKAKTKLAGYK